MFGKKETSKSSALPEIKVTKIPDDFYAGSNPVVEFENVDNSKKEKTPSVMPISRRDKKIMEQQTMTGAGNKLHPVNLFTNWKFLVLFSLAFLLVGGIIMGGYYYWQYRQSVVTVIPKPEINLPVASPVTSSEEILPTSTQEISPEVSTQPVQTLPALIEFPSILLSDSVDTDNDVVTDVGEGLFNTDPSNPDSDGDKYPDGHEVFYLYNPSGIEPMKLIDSGLISVYSNPSFSYSLYYPKSWVLGVVDVDQRDVLFSTITGENIEVRVFDRDPNTTFNDWFAINAIGERLEDYGAFESVFKESGFARKDNLAFFIVKDNFIYAIVYHTTDSNIVNYRQVALMLARSFQTGNETAIPERIVEENQNDLNVNSENSL